MPPIHPDREETAQRLLNENDLRVDVAHQAITRLPGCSDISSTDAAQVVAALDAYTSATAKKDSPVEKLTCGVLLLALAALALLGVAVAAAKVVQIWSEAIG
ncbi:hypothetical protein ACFVWN_01195 [Nocardiopsis flavescens]|uniref:hypothetical protein n=1 Tax=Nocardiopsis flavescens TaxID=758803 RepID=UPI0036508003